MISPALFLLPLALAADGKERVLIDKIVAVVNGEIITLSQLEAAATPFARPDVDPAALRADIIEQLVNEKLMEQQVKESKIGITDAELKAAIQDILRQNNLTEDQLMEALAARNMGFKEYQEDVKSQLIRLKLVDMKVRAKVVIPEDDLQAEYEIRTRDERAIRKVSLSHIFLRFPADAAPDQQAEITARAETLVARIKAGEDFAAVAKEASDGPTASSGGEMGEFEEDTLFPEFAKALKSMTDGEVSGPVSTPSGVHILRLDRRW
ncbi:MAG: peptidylprolyl isomerase, partial [Myxococcota bacterium]